MKSIQYPPWKNVMLLVKECHKNSYNRNVLTCIKGKEAWLVYINGHKRISVNIIIWTWDIPFTQISTGVWLKVYMMHNLYNVSNLVQKIWAGICSSCQSMKKRFQNWNRQILNLKYWILITVFGNFLTCVPKGKVVELKHNAIHVMPWRYCSNYTPISSITSM